MSVLTVFLVFFFNLSLFSLSFLNPSLCVSPGTGTNMVRNHLMFCSKGGVICSWVHTVISCVHGLMYVWVSEDKGPLLLRNRKVPFPFGHIFNPINLKSSTKAVLFLSILEMWLVDLISPARFINRAKVDLMKCLQIQSPTIRLNSVGSVKPALVCFTYYIILCLKTEGWSRVNTLLPLQALRYAW